MTALFALMLAASPAVPEEVPPPALEVPAPSAVSAPKRAARFIGEALAGSIGGVGGGVVGAVAGFYVGERLGPCNLGIGIYGGGSGGDMSGCGTGALVGLVLLAPVTAGLLSALVHGWAGGAGRLVGAIGGALLGIFGAVFLASAAVAVGAAPLAWVALALLVPGIAAAAALEASDREARPTADVALGDSRRELVLATW